MEVDKENRLEKAFELLEDDLKYIEDDETEGKCTSVVTVDFFLQVRYVLITTTHHDFPSHYPNCLVWCLSASASPTTAYSLIHLPPLAPSTPLPNHLKAIAGQNYNDESSSIKAGREQHGKQSSPLSGVPVAPHTQAVLPLSPAPCPPLPQIIGFVCHIVFSVCDILPFRGEKCNTLEAPRKKEHNAQSWNLPNLPMSSLDGNQNQTWGLEASKGCCCSLFERSISDTQSIPPVARWTEQSVLQPGRNV